MYGKNKILFIAVIVIIFDLFLVLIVISFSNLPGNSPVWSFTVADFIQVLVVEAALLGPYLFDYWKESKEWGSIKYLRVSSPDSPVGLERKLFGIEIMNNSLSIIHGCKVFLRNCIYYDPEESEEINFEINKYLCWFSNSAASISLNPHEPSIFIFGEVVDKWLVSGGKDHDSKYFKIVLNDEGVKFNQEYIFRNNCELLVYIFSENADIYAITIFIEWPRNVPIDEDFYKKILVKTTSFKRLG